MWSAFVNAFKITRDEYLKSPDYLSINPGSTLIMTVNKYKQGGAKMGEEQRRYFCCKAFSLTED